MSVFSQKLQALIQPRIDKGQLTIYGLARNSKIDRSSLYKFINGERLPASTEILSRLVVALRLSPTQAFELRAAYDISRMGEERYRRRRHTLEFLNFFNQYVGTQPAETLPFQSHRSHRKALVPTAQYPPGNQIVPTAPGAVLPGCAGF